LLGIAATRPGLPSASLNVRSCHSASAHPAMVPCEFRRSWRHALFEWSTSYIPIWKYELHSD